MKGPIGIVPSRGWGAGGVFIIEDFESRTSTLSLFENFPPFDFQIKEEGLVEEGYPYFEKFSISLRSLQHY